MRHLHSIFLVGLLALAAALGLRLGAEETKAAFLQRARESVQRLAQ